MRLETLAKHPIMVAVGALAIGVVLTLGLYFEDSKVLRETVQIAANHPVVVEALGTPIERSGRLGKRWRTTERIIGKRYDRDVPIAGPKGKGVLRITVTYQTPSRRARSMTRYENEELVGLRFQAPGTDHWQDLLLDERPAWATETDAARARAAADETPPPPPPPGGWVPLKPPPDGTPQKGPPVMPAEPAPPLKNW